MGYLIVDMPNEPFTKKRMKQLVDDGRSQFCYGVPPKPQVEVISRTYPNEEEAREKAEGLISRGYVDTLIFVPYYKVSNAKIRDKQRQLEETKNKKEKLKRETIFTNHKSQLITCKTCDSKLNRDYRWAKFSQCLVCGSDQSDANWVSIDEVDLEDEIIIMAYRQLTENLRQSGAMFGLMPEEFTLPRMQEVYEGIIGKKLSVSHFKSIFEGKIAKTGKCQRSGKSTGRPSQIYKKATES